MSIDKRPGVSSTVSYLTAPTITDTNNNLLLIGHRNKLDNNGKYLPLHPAPNFPNITPYQRYVLPTFGSTNSYISYMQSLGFQVEFGIENNLTFSAPTTVIANLNGTYTLIWTAVPPNTWSYLQGNGITINLSQGNATGTVINVSSTEYSLTIKVLSGTFNTNGGNVIFTTLNLNAPVLNKDKTDEIVLMVAKMAEARFNTTISQNVNLTLPNVFFVMLNDCTIPNKIFYDDGYTPSGVDVNLPTPDFITEPNAGFQYLYWNEAPDNSGILPNYTIGDSKVSQEIVLPTDNTAVLFYSETFNLFLRGSGGTAGVQWSTDCATWVNSSLTSGTITCMYDNGTSVVVGTSVGAYYSTNGKDFTVCTGLSTGIVNSLIHNGTAWIAATTAGLISTTTLNGSAGWAVISGTSAVSFNKLAYNTTSVMATSAAGIFYSADSGATFGLVTGTGTNGYIGIIYYNNAYIIGSSTTGGIVTATNASGVTATNITTGKYVAFGLLGTELVGVGTNVQKSSNGTSFTAVTAPTKTYNNIISSGTAAILTTTAGIVFLSNLTTGAVITNKTTGVYVTGIIGDANSPFLVGGTNGVLTSIDGLNYVATNTLNAQYVEYAPLNSGYQFGIVVSVTAGQLFEYAPILFKFDETQDIFNQIINTPGEQYRHLATPYEINSENLITNIKYNSMNNYVAYGNSQEATRNNQFGVIAYYSNTKTPKQIYSSLPTNDPSPAGTTANTYVFSYAPTFPTLGDLDLSAAELATGNAMLNAMNAVPFNPESGAITNLPVSSNISTLLTILDAKEILNLGITPYIYDPLSRQLKLERNVTNLLYTPGTNSPDLFAYPITNTQILFRWKEAVSQTLTAPQFTNQRQSGSIESKILLSLKVLSQLFETNGMFVTGSTALNAAQFTVKQDPSNPGNYLAETPINISNELNSIVVQVYIIEALNGTTVNI